jgi:WXG100 family type VII secretion target
MSGTYHVDEEVMASTISQIQSLVPMMQGELKQLNGEMQALFASWKGRSSQSFQRLHANWSQDYVKLNSALDGISQTLQKNLSNARSADEQSVVKG